MSSSGLLSLPPEIRLHIYGYILPIVPLSHSSSIYNGLLYSCKHFRHEFGAEIIKRMTALLQDIKTRCSNIPGCSTLNFEPPRTLNELYNLKVSRPEDIRLFFRQDPFMALMYLRFTSLTIITPMHARIDVPLYHTFGPFRNTQYKESLDRLVTWISRKHHTANIPACRHIQYIWSMDMQPEEWGYERARGELVRKMQQDHWTLRLWANKEGTEVRAFLRESGFWPRVRRS